MKNYRMKKKKLTLPAAKRQIVVLQSKIDAAQSALRDVIATLNGGFTQAELRNIANAALNFHLRRQPRARSKK